MPKIKLKHPVRIFYSLVITAILFAIASFFTPPVGEISNSMLILIAQFLILSATIIIPSLKVELDLKNKEFSINKDNEE